EDVYNSDVDEGPHAAAAFMANLSSTSGTNGATTSHVNEVHTNDNQIFDNVNHLLAHEMYQEEHLDFDVESDIDDNMILYHQYQLDSEVQDVPTKVSSVSPGEISMITILDDLRNQLDGHLKVNQEQSMVNDSLRAELARFQAEVSRTKMSNRPGIIKPINYVELNVLYSHFVPQKELSREQVYWLPAEELATQKSNPPKPVTSFVHTHPTPSKKNHIDLQIKFRNYKECLKNQTIGDNSHSPAVNAVFEINQLKEQLQRKEDTIMKLQTHINSMSMLNVEPTVRSSDKQALENELTQLKDAITSVRIQNDGFKLTTLTAENAKLKSESLSKIHSEPIVPEKPKVLAPGMYAISYKYIVPPRRVDRAELTPFPKKKQATFLEPHIHSNRPTQKTVMQQNKKPNIYMNLSTGVEPSTGASKPMSKSDSRNHSTLLAKRKKARRVEDRHRNLNKQNHVDSRLNVKRTGFVSNSNTVCNACNESLVFANDDNRMVCNLKSVNVKTPTAKHNVKTTKKVWKAKVVTIRSQWNPTGRRFTLYDEYPLTRTVEPIIEPLELTLYIIRKLMGDMLPLDEILKEERLLAKILLRVPRQNNMYNIDLKNIVPTRGNLVRGFPSKIFKMINPVLLVRKASNTEPLAKAVNNACYVQNRVSVTKPHNKTPYELFHGVTPAISFLRPFGCPVTILNTIEHLGKFDGKADEGFFVGYSLNSKAFRVFNSRTRIVEENLHVRFSENTPNNVASSTALTASYDATRSTYNVSFGIVVVRDEMLDNLRQINMKLNPKKCSFRVDEGKLLGYMVTSEGIRANPTKTKDIEEMQSSKTWGQIQSLSRKLAALNRFLSRSAEKSLPFFKTVKNITKENKDDDRWTEDAEYQQQAIYEALLARLRIAKKMKVQSLSINVDFKLVLRRLSWNDGSHTKLLELDANHRVPFQLCRLYLGSQDPQIQTGSHTKLLELDANHRVPFQLCRLYLGSQDPQIQILLRQQTSVADWAEIHMVTRKRPNGQDSFLRQKPYRDDRYCDDPNRSLGLKIKIFEFTCKVHTDDFIDWLSTVKRVFDVRDIPNKMKVKLITIKLRQHALLWNMTVEEVINEFNKLRMRCDVIEEEEQVVAWFLEVFKPEIADIVSLQPYWTYTDVYHLSLNVEKDIKAKSLIYDTESKPDLDQLGDELVYPERREALVIQRVLNVAVSKSVDDSLWLCNNIFRTKCTSKEKNCDMIIDGGSYENVIYTYMVKKLGMKIEDHLEPYQLTWLKKGTQLRKTKHDGFPNTYSFQMDGVNITLVLFYSRQIQEEGSTLFMNNNDFEGLMKNSPYVFTLVVVEENEIINEAPLQV
nr:reverse transcriptase domain-containing protein [Tanacetum cinerariifolium]